DILDMNKIVGKNFELHPEPYPFEEFKSYIVAIIAPLCLKKGIACIIDNLELEGAFLVDRLRFNQIFVNILSNSVKYTKSGGHVHLCFANVAADDKTFIGEIIVEDNGIGMSDEFQKKMFEPFTQEKETMANMGSGLGLFIVKQLVESMGGSIRVESKPRRGSRFIVSLSLELVPYEKEKVIVQDDKNLLDGLRVLMCEDNEINAEIASQMLERKGVTVDVAENGKVGLEKFSNSEDGYYDLILMDIRMPVMDGFETAKEIQQLDRSDAKEIPIIALTADAYLQDEEKSTSCGMVAHIAKPVNADCLYETIERCIRARDKVRSSWV
ncbi:MAG: response regulator, partial [Treponema sp.]|nr:response regulator [Treponema sp.]